MNKNELIKEEPSVNRVFVYGTLMRDFKNYKRYLEGRVNRITQGQTYGELYHLPEGYPALLEGDDNIKGEIVEPVDEKLLKSLDRLEGYAKGRKNNLYERKVKCILTENGEEIACWVYIYAKDRHAREKGIRITHGDWRKFMEEKRSPYDLKQDLYEKQNS